MNFPVDMRAGRCAVLGRFQMSVMAVLCAWDALNAQVDVWIGTGSAWPSEGIYITQLNPDTGKLSRAQLAAEIRGPGFLAMHPKGSHLYAVGSLDQKSVVACYAIEKRDGNDGLKFVNALEIGDGGGTHVSVNKAGNLLLTAQYGGGSVASFSLNADGSLAERKQLLEHSGGSGVVAGRQNSPHPHWTGFSPDQRFAFVPDLGLDRVMIYAVDGPGQTIRTHGFAEVPAGGGPRHMKFHPNGRWVYVLNELDLSVTTFDYDAANGSMESLQTLPSVPKEQLAKEQFKSASEIRVHPNGRFVYSANRGHDTITAYKVDPDAGTLQVIEREHVRGATPRNFNIDPSGRWLLAAGQNSHTLASFAIDSETGELTYNQSVIHAPSAICVLFEHE